jgi:RimJ/RimL family protein N-acetyltransferase
MHLTSIYTFPDRRAVLYELLRERDDTVNISHKEMPSFDEHCRFVESHPYMAWYFIVQADKVVGTCYLTKQGEIGAQVFKAYRGHGYGRDAVKVLMWKHGDRRYLANINPRNEASIAMFGKLGFKQCQVTFEKPV